MALDIDGSKGTWSLPDGVPVWAQSELEERGRCGG